MPSSCCVSSVHDLPHKQQRYRVAPLGVLPFFWTFSCLQLLTITAKLPFFRGFRYDSVTRLESGESRFQLPRSLLLKDCGGVFLCLYLLYTEYSMDCKG